MVETSKAVVTLTGNSLKGAGIYLKGGRYIRTCWVVIGGLKREAFNVKFRPLPHVPPVQGRYSVVTLYQSLPDSQHDSVCLTHDFIRNS